MSRKQKRPNKPSPVIDLVVTTAGRFDVLEVCLNAIYREAQEVPISLTIIDNASPAEERIQNNHLFDYWADKDAVGNITFFSKRLQQNIGFPGSANEGGRVGKSPLIMFISDDVELHEGTLKKIVDDFQAVDNVGIVGIKLIFPPNSTSPIRPAGKVQHIGLSLNINGEVVHPLVGWSPTHPKTQISRDVWAVTGACFTIRREIFNKTGGFDKVFGRGCLSGDSLIFTDSGVLSLCDVLNNNSYDKEWSADIDMRIGVDSLLGVTESNLFHRNGIETVKKMTVTGGYDITGTLNHKFVVMKSDGTYDWKELKDIKRGDFVAIKYGSDLWGENKLNLDDAYLLGLYIAEGSTEKIGEHRGRITITNADKEIIDFLEKYGFHTSGVHHRLGTQEFYGFMLDLGINPNEKATTKSIPSTIMLSNRDTVISFLQGLFDGDGCAIRDGRVTYSTSSIQLAKEVQLLLLNFGIVSSISKKPSFPNVRYTIDLGGDSSVFYSEIGFRLGRKQSRAKFVRKTRSKTLPHQRRWLKALYELAGWKSRNNKLLSMHASNPSKGVRRDIIKMFLNERKEFSHTESYKHLEELLNLSIYWAEVKSLVDLGEQETFDIHVPIHNHYIANGFVSHNTFEDVDLCLKARQLGFRIYIDADAQAYHYVGATAEKRKEAFPLQENKMIFHSRWINTPFAVWDEGSFY